MDSFLNVTWQLLQGFWETLKLFLLTLAFSLPLGLVLSFGTRSKYRPLRALLRGFVWVIRGTPLMLQLIAVFYGPGLLLGVSGLSRMEAVVAAFSINYACYFSEIYRGGMESIPAGQYEAGQVLGLNRRQVFFRIVLQQVVKRILPPMSNEIITLVKDTALARIIAVYEITWVGQSYIKKGLIWPLFYTGAFYLLFNGLLTVGFGKLEEKLDNYKG